MVRLEIAYKGNTGGWLLYRTNGERAQHGHFRRLREAERVRDFIYDRIWPNKPFYRESVRRLLTPDEIYEWMGVEVLENTNACAAEIARVWKKPAKKRPRGGRRRRKYR